MDTAVGIHGGTAGMFLGIVRWVGSMGSRHEADSQSRRTGGERNAGLKWQRLLKGRRPIAAWCHARISDDATRHYYCYAGSGHQ